MGEHVDRKGRVSYFCECCGVHTHNSHYCVACEPPDTVREPAGEKWWGWPSRALLARRHLIGYQPPPPPQPEPQPQPPRRRGRPPKSKSEGSEPMPTRQEGVFLHAMMDALREMLGLDPLYGAKKEKSPFTHYDERDREWKS